MRIWDSRSSESRKTLEAEQIALELQSLDLGVQRYRSWRRDTDASRGTPEQRIIGQALDQVVPAIEAARQAVLSKGGAGRGVAYWGYQLWVLSPEKLAVLALVTMMNAADEGSSMEVLCRTIGSRVEQEYQFEQFREHHRKLFDVVSKKIKNWTPRQLGYMRGKVEQVDARWPLRVRHWVGYKLVELIWESTNLFHFNRYQTHRHGKRRNVVELQLQPEVRAELEKQHTNCEVLRPYYLPMVHPPSDWEFGTRGGFRYHKYPMVKPQNLTDHRPEEVEHGPIVYAALNAVQGTGWRINRRVYEVMAQVWRAGGGWAGLPTAEPKPLPPQPDDIDTNLDSKIEWKLAASRVYTENAHDVTKRKSALNKLRTAGGYLETSEFFFPWQYDYRGRMYPVAGDLHPQSDDVARGLLEFSEGKPLGQRGYDWLRVRLANCFGVDKVSFADRIRWANEHGSDIHNAGVDPLRYKWWAKADDPWQALATCIELCEAWASGDVETYVSHLPVQKDGSCNGLQHFAAMCLDPVAGATVNLIPSDTPHDIYEQIARLVAVRVEEDARQEINHGAESPSPASQWVGRITRKTVKRATMTLPYGVTLQGMADQFVSDGHTAGMEKPRSCAVYLRDLTWEALEDTVVSAQRVMGWLKAVASATAKKNHVLQWTTPSGFHVTQESLEYRDTSIYTLLQRIRIHQANDEGRISPHRQQRCMPPNFVHSLDAAHLMLTVNEMARRGITAFSFIHDSYGTHACDVDVMDEVLRYQFVRMYQFDGGLLHGYWSQWCWVTDLDLPSPPKQGSLDLIQVLNSPYFFG